MTENKCIDCKKSASCEEYGGSYKYCFEPVHTSEHLQVLFQNSNNKTRVIGSANTQSEAFKVIDGFLVEHNYKSYYKRTWKPDEKTTYVDVGSHTEKFIIKEI